MKNLKIFRNGLIIPGDLRVGVKNLDILKNNLIILGDLPVYKIHENNFNNGFIFQVTYLFAKYLKVISTLVSFFK